MPLQNAVQPNPMPLPSKWGSMVHQTEIPSSLGSSASDPQAIGLVCLIELSDRLGLVPSRIHGVSGHRPVRPQVAVFLSELARLWKQRDPMCLVRLGRETQVKERLGIPYTGVAATRSSRVE